MRAGKRVIGHTLIELIVAVAVVVYLMVMVAWALVYCNRYLRNCETKAEAQTQSLSAMIWLSRSITEANVTTMNSTYDTTAGIYGVTFPSPRDPGDGTVSWDPATGGILWRQQVYCYLVQGGADIVPYLQTKGFPMSEPSGTTTVQYPGTGAPYPATSYCVDLPDPTSLETVTQAMTESAVLTKTVAPNIRSLSIAIYSPNQAGGDGVGGGFDANWAATLAAIPGALNTCNMTIEGFAPYYGLNYGVTVSTNVRITN